MAPLALSKNDYALLTAVFKLTSTNSLDYAKVSNELGIKKELMPSRMHAFRKKLKLNSPSFSTNDHALMVAAFKLLNITGLDYAKIATDIGVKKELMPSRMHVLRKKLGVAAPRAAKKTAARVNNAKINKETTKSKKSAKAENFEDPDKVDEAHEADEVKEFDNGNDGYDSDATLVGDGAEEHTMERDTGPVLNEQGGMRDYEMQLAEDMFAPGASSFEGQEEIAPDDQLEEEWGFHCYDEDEA